MKNFESIAKGIKFDGDVDFDKVRTMTITKDDLNGGSRLSGFVQYDNGLRFETVGEFTKHAEPEAAQEEAREPVVLAKAPKVQVKR